MSARRFGTFLDSRCAVSKATSKSFSSGISPSLSKLTPSAADSGPSFLVFFMIFRRSLLAKSWTKMSRTPNVNPSVCKKLVKILEKADNKAPE